MDSKNFSTYIYFAILFIFPNILYTQRITCPRPCNIGETCSMVRHGNEPSRPGCINMQEAIMLHQAMNGGPSGPGTGISTQVGTNIGNQVVTGVGNPVGAGFQQGGFPQSPRPGDPIPPFPPTSMQGDSIPGMDFLSRNVPPPQQDFEQRFQSGIGRQPQSFIDPTTNMLGQQGNFGMSGFTGRINGQFGNPQGPVGMTGPRFLDPTAGQFGPAAGQFGPAMGQFGPIAGQFGPMGGVAGRPPIGMGPQVDGAHNHISSASGNRDNTNLVGHDSSNGGGNLHNNNVLTGEKINSDFNVDSQFNSDPTTLSENNFNTIPDGFIGTETFANNEQDTTVSQLSPVVSTGSPQHTPVEVPVKHSEPNSNVNTAPLAIDLNGINRASLETLAGEQSKVTSIRQDSSGLHYIFFPRARSAGFRVDITKDGFCPRDALARDNTCMNLCYSDQQCDLDQKCCPIGCSLRCRNPYIPVRELNLQPEGGVPNENV